MSYLTFSTSEMINSDAAIKLDSLTYDICKSLLMKAMHLGTHSSAFTALKMRPKYSSSEVAALMCTFKSSS